MKFVACDISKVMGGKRTKSGIYELLFAFAESDIECAKIEGYTHKTPYSCAHSLNASIKRYHLLNLEAFTRDGEVYLIKKNKVKKD